MAAKDLATIGTSVRGEVPTGSIRTDRRLLRWLSREQAEKHPKFGERPSMLDASQIPRGRLLRSIPDPRDDASRKPHRGVHLHVVVHLVRKGGEIVHRPLDRLALSTHPLGEDASLARKCIGGGRLRNGELCRQLLVWSGLALDQPRRVHQMPALVQELTSAARPLINFLCVQATAYPFGLSGCSSDLPNESVDGEREGLFLRNVAQQRMQARQPPLDAGGVDRDRTKVWQVRAEAVVEEVEGGQRIIHSPFSLDRRTSQN